MVILHLSPEHDSTLPALLQNVTALPVKAVQDGERLQADHVYVIPPARQLTVSNGHLRLTRADMDLYEAIERAVEVSTPDIEAKGQRLTVTLEGPTCPYHGDFARLQQVFWNLLKNASKFTPPGGAIEIRSHCQTEGQFVVEVVDTGIGLEADAIERIFRPFEQASNSITREFGGLGLGLAIAKATVDAHGGTLSVSSPGLGRGATFTASLPRTTAQGDAVAGTA